MCLPGAPGAPGCWGAVHLPSWPQFGEGQADGQGQGLPGQAKWGRAAGSGDLGILNQLLRQVWAARLSRVHWPPGGSPASCWRVWGGQAGHSPGQQSQQRVDGAGGCRRASHPTWFPTTPHWSRMAPQLLRVLA